MIARYAAPEMTALWSEERKFRTWLRIEILAAEKMAEMGLVPAEDLAEIKAKAAFDIPRIDALERTLKHDVIAFLTSVSEHVGPAARWLHLGMTSSDVLDTALGALLAEAMDMILAETEGLAEAIRDRAFEHKRTPTMGRSHGIHAEPTTFGLKLAVWYDEVRRHLRRLRAARETVAYGKISGAVGTFANVAPEVEAYVCEKLGLAPAPASTQILQRDRHAECFSALALYASSIEKFAVEIRHLQRTEVREAEEPFTKGQKGSSAMPHKRNPVLSENLTGLARLVRGYALSAMENVALWHERDISHSSVERVIAPDATTLVHFMTRRAKGLVRNLVVYPDAMRRNLDLMGGVMYSQRVLLELAKRGLAREEAYAIVQRCAMRVWEEGIEFEKSLLADADVRKHLSEAEVRAAFDLDHHLKHVDTIFERVFGKANP